MTDHHSLSSAPRPSRHSTSPAGLAHIFRSSPTPSEPPARAANLPDPTSSPRFPGDDTPRLATSRALDLLDPSQTVHWRSKAVELVGDVLPSSFSSPSRRRAPPQPAASRMLSLHSHTPSDLPPRAAACSILHRLVRRRAFPESLVSPPSIPSTFSASIVRPSLTSLRILRQTPHLEPKDRRTGLCLNPPVYSSRDVALNGARCLVPHRPFSTLTCKPHPRKSHLPFSQDCTPCAPGLRRARSRRCWPLIASPALAGIPGPQGDIFPLALPSISVPHVSTPGCSHPPSLIVNERPPRAPITLRTCDIEV
ncbi:hypothetical protein B0H13DRAFT_2370090 [Mycena leptocephala]|nr:hypothetical protein B0H13DRAFT_2370090 [Mycena leptocephala]